MNTIQERLQALRQQMKKSKVQAYIIPTSDFHDTEYVCDYFSSRKYMSGFTGSAGTLVVLMDKAALWTDGRYFIQAAKQLEGSGIQLMKMGVAGTPSIEEYILENLKAGECVGFDGRTVSANDGRSYKRRFALEGIDVNENLDLVGDIWKDRPALPQSQTFYYPKEYSGKDSAEILADVRKIMKEKGAKHHIITKIDEIAWLYNIRANDIPSFPVALAYTIVNDEDAVLYIDSSRLDEKSKEALEKDGVKVKDYDKIYKDAKKLKNTVMIDPSFVNYTLYSALNPGHVIEENDPVILMKAIKNKTELDHTRNAHLKDGAAVSKFMYWLKQNAPKETETEISAGDKLQSLRKEQDAYIEDSFNAIVAYKDHAAMMHYSSTPESDVILKGEGMLLVDSGGHYMDGTTDITRTFVLGPISEEEKYWFTKALQGHIQLQQAKFLYGCRGLNLDILCRQPLWKEGMDYQCGTGHGVGHLLSVHEAPNGFRWKIVPERNDSAVLEEGMISSNEPGVYEEGKFGIRHENEMTVVKKEANKYGQFMGFENLTFVPFDKDGIDPKLLNPSDIQWLNDYHAQVYDKLKDRLNPEEKEWLQQACAPIEYEA